MHRHGNRYAVLVKHVEEMAEQRQQELGIQLQDARTVVHGLPGPQEDAPRPCRLKPGSGPYDHLDQCPGSSNSEPLSMCSFEKIHESERKLRGLELQKSLILCFHNPRHAGEIWLYAYTLYLLRVHSHVYLTYTSPNPISGRVGANLRR